MYKIIAKPVLRSIRRKVGLDQIRMFTIGSAPSSDELKHFFISHDMVPVELYGMSESTGMVAQGFDSPKSDNSLKIIKLVQVGIDTANNEGQGEIKLRSRQIFMGYLDDLDGTARCRSNDGWYHTGDVGCITDDGSLVITGREKEIIITSSGFNIPPHHIESSIKSELPGVSDVFLIGNRRKYLSCLVAIKVSFIFSNWLFF